MAKALTVDTPQTGLERAKTQPERLLEFLRSVRSEMHRVVWPNRAEVQSNTIVVLVTVFVFAAYFWLVDTMLGNFIERGIGHLTQR